MKRQISTESVFSLRRFSNSVGKASVASIRSFRRLISKSDLNDPVSQQIEQVRVNVFVKVKECPGLYDPRDLFRLRRDPYFVSRFVADQSSVKSTADAVNATLLWRKKNRLNDDLLKDIPKEFWEVGILNMGKDQEGLDVGYIRLKYLNSKLIEEWMDETKMFLHHIMERMGQRAGGGQWALVIDFSGAGVSNFSFPFISYAVSCIFSHYPLALKYVWLFEPSWYLKPLIASFLVLVPLKYRHNVKIINRKQGQKEMGDQFPAILGGTAKVDTLVLKDMPPFEELKSTRDSPEDKKKRARDYCQLNFTLLQKENHCFSRTNSF